MIGTTFSNITSQLYSYNFLTSVESYGALEFRRLVPTRFPLFTNAPIKCVIGTCIENSCFGRIIGDLLVCLV